MPIRLLLLDDEEGFVEALTRRLVRQNYRAAYVLSGEEALRFLDEDRSVDVVLLDVEMPGLDGLETLRRIKAAQPLVETIMLTAHATIATAVEAMRIGARDYLMKPCDFEELAAEKSRKLKRSTLPDHSSDLLRGRQHCLHQIEGTLNPEEWIQRITTVYIQGLLVNLL
jgi:DNA-binding NtrC family response regulator